MSISSFIADKKAKFKNRIEARQNTLTTKRETRLKELEVRNKVLEEDLKLKRELERAELKNKSLSRQSRADSFAGKVFNNIKSKATQKSSNEGNIFTAGNGGNSSIFMQGGGKNVFSQQSKSSPFNPPQHKLSAPIKSKTIVKYK